MRKKGGIQEGIQIPGLADQCGRRATSAEDTGGKTVGKGK